VNIPDIRVGHGFDVHRWGDDESKPLVIGGVEFPDAASLVGHSDSDVVTHACIDAILTAAGQGDIGVMFADTDPRWKGADSVNMLRRAAKKVRDAGWEPVNVDCTVIADVPRISPHREVMESRLSEALGAPVTVKGKTTEGLISYSEGIQASAVALVRR